MTNTPPDETAIQTLKGRIMREIYVSNDGKFGIFSVKKSGQEYSLTTPLNSPVAVGDEVVATGKWDTYKGKPQFKALATIIAIPQDLTGIVGWFTSGKVKGIGRKTATKVAKVLGKNLMNALMAGDTLTLIGGGLTAKQATAAVETWGNAKEENESVSFLAGLGLGEAAIAKVIEAWGPVQCRSKINENPWALALKIEGIGFSTADKVALSMGRPADSVDRIVAGMNHVLDEQTAKNGHCGISHSDLVYETSRTLKLSKQVVNNAYPALIKEGQAIEEEWLGLVFPKKLAIAEQKIAEVIAGKVHKRGLMSEERAQEAIAEVERRIGIELSSDQRLAAVTALSRAICVITGGPGTGKSTIQRVIAEIYAANGVEMALCAPTGRAAKGLAEKTKMDALTIHRLLGWNPVDSSFLHNESMRLKARWLDVDEFSMVDTPLCASVMRALHDDAIMTIIGDVDQLPSVGPGQVLKDIIGSEVVPVVRLERIHRQAEDSGIVMAAHRVRTGLMPLPEDGESLPPGFEFIEAATNASALQNVVEVVRDLLVGMGYDPLYDVQTISGMRRGETGIEALNELLKNALNAPLPGTEARFGNKTFSPQDRIMQIRNDYDILVFNGEIGIATAATTGEESFLSVSYSGNNAVYDKKTAANIELAWAITAHKSQGAEYPVVVVLCTREQMHMMNRSLLYTAITRAKAHCIVIGQKSALQNAVRTENTLRRKTGLARRIRRAAGLPDLVPPAAPRADSPRPGPPRIPPQLARMRPTVIPSARPR